MANLAISAVCNQDCPYCFTADHRAARRAALAAQQSRRERDYLGLQDLEVRLDFLRRSGIDQARLIGGEPTLHPQFAQIAERARAAGLTIAIFTNGLMPESVLSYLASLPVAECSVLVNVNDPALAGNRAHARRLAALQRLGERAAIGVNIYRPDLRLDFILPLIAETGCQPAVRLGMAQPCLSGQNQHIHPRQYTAVGIQVARFFRTAVEAGVKVEFDCGFVPCMFAEQDLKMLQNAGSDVGWHCNPILDIDIEGRVLHCYPLSSLCSFPLSQDADAPSLREAFESRTRLYRQAGVFQECSTCPLKASGECPGGCLAATIRRFHHTPFRLHVPRRVPRQELH